MLATKAHPYLSPELPDAVPAEAAGDERVNRKPDDLACRQAWNEIIDTRLIEWGLDARDFEDEGIRPPSSTTLSLAGRIAAAMRDKGCSPPTRVVPDTNGGIVFERRQNEVFETIRVSADGDIEQCLFVNGRLLHRESY
jgi:hypothetical protein